MEKRFDLIGLGECLIEFYEEAPHIYKQSVAGDVFNTLFYASRRGLKTGFISNVGAEDLTKNIFEVMDREGIDRSCISRSLEKNNGLYLVSAQKGEPKYSFWRNDSAARETLAELDEKKIEEYILSARYFHFSAIALWVLHQNEKLISILKKVHGQPIITFDTNFRNGLWEDIEVLRKFISKSFSFIDILFVSKSDDENIFGKRTAEEAINFYSSLGYKNTIYRQGSDDVFVKAKESLIRVPAQKNVKEIDPTGAGDAFNAGFIAAQIQGMDMKTSIENANRCAAFVITRHGGLVEDFRENVK